jgi:site-specific recombinase XerD
MKMKDPKLYATIKRFLKHYLPNIRSRSPHTIRAYQDSINLFLEFLKRVKELPMPKVTTDDFNGKNVVDFLSWLQTERKCGISTRNQRLMSLRSFCKYMSAENMLLMDNYAQIEQIIPTPTAERILSEVPTLQQMQHLLTLPDSTKYGIRDRFYIALLYDTGCRNDEILSMKLGDFVVKPDEGEARVVGKGRKYRVTPISLEVCAIFKPYARIFHPEQNLQKHLFYVERDGEAVQMSQDNTARILKKYEALARATYKQLPHLHPHLLRHARAIHLYQSGMPLAIIGEWLGHSHLETTQIYAYADTKMKRAAVERCKRKTI